MQRRLSLALLLLVCGMIGPATAVSAASGSAQLAQAQPAQAAADAPQAVEEPIGNVATVVGSASVTRSDATRPLRVKDDIYLNDVVQTAANSSLGITFSDATTFNLKANSQITIDTYLYEDGGKQNAGVFDVARGTVAFVAAAVARTGDMKITTPTAALGIRGTTGLVEVPEGAAANNPKNVAIKLYPDADGRVGRIEVNDRAGARLGFLTQAASGFTIRPGAGGVRLAAVPLTISPQQILRDQGFVRQVHSTQALGSRVVDTQRAFRRANPGLTRDNAPRRSGPGGLPAQNRNGLQQPGQPNRPGQPGLQNRPGQPRPPGAPNRQGQPLPRPGSTQPGSPQQTGLPEQPRQPAAIGRLRPGAVQGLPGVLPQRLPIRPGVRPPPPPKSGKPPPKERRLN